MAAAPAFSGAVAPRAVLDVMQRVADWQLANPSEHAPTDWTQGVGASGVMALAGISGDRKYRDALLAMGEQNAWKLGPRPYHADEHAIGQTYAELYLQLRDPKMIAPLRAHFDYLLDHPREGSLQIDLPDSKDRWSWCDALFMAPPAWARLYAATGDQRYLDLAVSHWWRTSDYLYDKQEHLFYRDSKRFALREANGKKIFWSRGNGWVMGGLVRMLQYLPANHPARPRFEQQFKEMAAKVLALQPADGMWRASLLDPDSWPMPETSGTGLFTYALAWGVNQGLLERARFEPAVRRAWSGLVSAVDRDGKLTHVQPIGAAPKTFDINHTDVYGVGAFLLAGSEMYRMAVLAKLHPQVVSVTNKAPFHRADETVEVALRGADVAVMDGSSSRIVDSQVIDHTLLFQATLAPGETRRYLLVERARLAATPPPDVKTHARFVPERLDDFAWESDRIAHRTYGPALITSHEKLVTSGIDVWAKSVRGLVLEKWYKADSYHKDAGEGLDYYHVGTSRGCGGLGIYNGQALFNSSNFSSWKVLADGPLRSVFELRFENWDADGRTVAELRRMSIDAGSNFTRIETRFSSPQRAPLQVGIGIAQRKGEGRYAQDAAAGWMSYWEPQHGSDGHIACAVMIPGAAAVGFAQYDSQYLALAKAQPGKPLVYYMGAGWSKGDFPTPEQWEAYVASFSQRLAAPLVVKSTTLR
jgi:rhamnogalacturonyl hydrolase YesR